MNKPQPRRMQRLSRETEGLERCCVAIMRPAIDRITQQWMADVGHVHAHLMGASGLELALDQRGPGKWLEGPEMRHCALASAIASDGNFLAVCGGSGERRIDLSGRRRGVSVDYRLIEALDTVIEKLPGQTFMRLVAFGDDNQT